MIILSGIIVLVVLVMYEPSFRMFKRGIETNDLVKTTSVLPTALNRTNPDAKVLVYNKVPKCGSTKMWNTLKGLAKKHKYQHIHSFTSDVRRLNTSEENELANELSKHEKKIIYERHFYTLDWTRHEQNLKVNLMNMVRDPVERAISMFNYIRAPRVWDGKGPKINTHMPNASWFAKTLETCVLENDQECQIGGSFPFPGPKKIIRTDMVLTYFCGTHVECLNPNSEWALNQAKQNVESLYSVVGVMEEYRESLAVMEAYLPGWLGGANKVFNSTTGHKNKNKHGMPSEEVLTILNERYKLDTEFYMFVKQRLRLQMNKLGIQAPDNPDQENTRNIINSDQ